MYFNLLTIVSLRKFTKIIAAKYRFIERNFAVCLFAIRDESSLYSVKFLAVRGEISSPHIAKFVGLRVARTVLSRNEPKSIY